MNSLLKSVYNSISQVVNRDKVTPNNSTLIPIPKELVDKKDPTITAFIKTAGHIHKDPSIPITVEMQPKKTVHNDKEYETINFIFRFDSDLDLDRLKSKLGLD